MSKVFLTGGTGLLGTRLRARLEASGVAFVDLPRGQGADLRVPSSYSASLAGVDTVVHLAAATGKATPALHAEVNLGGTKGLLEQCRRAGVRRFIFVSSIAAGFPDLSRYPYA